MSRTGRAAVVMLQNHEGKYLVVWNRRYGGFSFPGGRVEEGETTDAAALRELGEETGIRAIGSPELVFEGSHGITVDVTRGSTVSVFRVAYYEGVATEMEQGCPVTWWTREEFLKWSPFAVFYVRVFAALSARSEYFGRALAALSKSEK